jgi:hypothetical protein
MEANNMNKLALFGFIVILIFISGCISNVKCLSCDRIDSEKTITDFESCAAAGNPVMESYPRQCGANGQTFVEVIDKPIGGETDEHGCMLMAGYTWCESKQMCLREWEKECPAGGELIGASCGTVSPTGRNECCARKMAGAIKPACVGAWKWDMQEGTCKFLCETQTVEDTSKAVLYKEDDQLKRILCESDEDCSFEKLTGSYSELDLPSCSVQLSCKGGICVYSC